MSERSADDSLTDVLTHYRTNARVYASPTVCGAWRFNPTGLHDVGFHLIASGSCFLHRAQPSEPDRLKAGDLVFVTRSAWHVLSPESALDGTDTWLNASGDGTPTELICGSIGFGSPQAERLLQALPDVLVMRSGDGEHARTMQALARLMAAESTAQASGRQMVLDRLADIVFLLVLRHAIDRGLATGGVLAALADPRLHRALDALHQSPGRQWTLDALAAEAGLSRTAFAQRFSSVVGETPMNYLAGWRMQLADEQLRDRQRSVAQIAEALGYATEAAFRRAFKRIRGVPPGAVRRKALTPAAAGQTDRLDR
jgi:AraC family transcriptional regulator, activator of mtrCDE